jgi:PKD repeat protein
MRISIQDPAWDVLNLGRPRTKPIRESSADTRLYHSACWCLLHLFLIVALIQPCRAQERASLVTYGADAQTAEGDDDFKQVIFFTIPKTAQSDRLHLRIFDPDVGGEWDQQYGEWDTQTRFRLYGGQGAYTAPTARSPFPEEGDRLAGDLIADAIFGVNSFSDNKWFNYAAFTPAQGEEVEEIIVFKLVVDGVRGDDGNIFEVAISTHPKRNNPPDGLKIINYCPTIRLPAIGVHAELRFSVPDKVQEITIRNFDLAGAFMAVETRFRSNLSITTSEQGEWEEDRLVLEPDETGTLAALTYEGGYEMPNDATFFVTDEKGEAMPMLIPAYILKRNTRPVPEVSLTPLSDCRSIMFDAKGSLDEDGDALAFLWEFGDGSTGRGSRIIHQFPHAGQYEATLVVTDDSDSVGNSSRERLSVHVNHTPVAEAGEDLIGEIERLIPFDGTASKDPDGKIERYIWNFGDGARAIGQTVTHAYKKSGRYIVTLRVEDDSGSPCNFGLDQAEVWINAPPVVDIGEDRIISPDETIHLSGERSYDSDGEIVAYLWDFGDGTLDSGIKVSHQYSMPGTYHVMLTVQDNTRAGNNIGTDRITVIVNDPPQAAASADRRAVAPGEEIVFDGSASVDRDGNLIGFYWDMGDAAIMEGTRVTHQYEKPGLYTVKLAVRDDSGTSTDTDADSLLIFVNQAPRAEAGPPQLVSSSEVRFDGTGSTDSDSSIIEYSWDFGDGSSGSGPEPLHIYGNPGTYTVKLTVTDDSNTSNGTDTDETTVVVNSAPIADAGPPLTAAPGEELAFDGSSSFDPDGEIREFLWDFGDGQTARGPKVTHAYEKPGYFTAMITVHDNTGHTSAMSYDITTVFINSPPIAIAGRNILASPGQTIEFDGSRSYDPDGRRLSYQWDFSDGNGAVRKAKMKRSFKKPGIYTATLTVVDDSGASNAQAQSRILVHINSRPIAKPGKDLFTCETKVHFDGSASADPDGDPLTYFWDFGDGSPAKMGVKVYHAYDKPGIYPVILTVDDGTGLDNARHSSSIVATINQAPLADAGGSRTVCAGDVVLFSGSGSIDPEGGLLKYHWDFGDGSETHGMNPTKTYTKGGVYSVTLTVKDDSGLSCDTGVDKIIVQVAESPVADGGPDMTVCAGTEVRFDGTRSTDFDGLVNRYTWDFGDGTLQDGPKPTHAFSEPGTYVVTLTIYGDRIGDCDNVDTDELIVTAHEAPTAKLTMSTGIGPVDEPVVFDASRSESRSANIVSWRWDFGDGQSGEGETAEHVYHKSGKYFVNLTITSDSDTVCNSATARDIIIINDPPVAEAGPDQHIGLNQVVTFDGSGSTDPDGSIATYTWDFGDGNSATGVQVRHRYTQAGKHKVTLRVTDQTDLKNNWATDALFVIVNNTPVARIAEIPMPQCVGEPVQFSGKGSFDPDGTIQKYVWDFGDGSTAQGLEAEHAYKMPGSYHVALVVDDGSGVLNSTNEATVTATINSPPMAEAGPDCLVCPGDKVPFDGSECVDRDGVIQEYVWSFGDGLTGEGKRLAHAYAQPGQYQAVLTIRDNSGTNCDAAQGTRIVHVNAPPVADAGPDMEAFYGGAYDVVHFDGTGSHDQNGDPLTFHWDFGDGTVGIGPKVSHVYKRAGAYTVVLRVSDGTHTICGESRDELTVTVRSRETARR